MICKRRTITLVTLIMARICWNFERILGIKTLLQRNFFPLAI